MSYHEVSDSQDAAKHKIHIMVKGQDQRHVYFVIAADKKLDTLFNAYCRKRDIDARSVQFLYKGQRIQGYQTPRELKMKCNSKIDAMMHEMGGGSQGNV